MNSSDRVTLAVFIALTVLYIGAVWATRPRDDDPPTWHKRPHE